MTKYKQSFEKCAIKIQRTQDAYKFRREITEITSSINSRVRLWKINHSGPGCSFYEFYEWYTFQENTRVYIIKASKTAVFYSSNVNKCSVSLEIFVCLCSEIKIQLLILATKAEERAFVSHQKIQQF